MLQKKQLNLGMEQREREKERVPQRVSGVLVFCCFYSLPKMLSTTGSEKYSHILRLRWNESKQTNKHEKHVNLGKKSHKNEIWNPKKKQNTRKETS